MTLSGISGTEYIALCFISRKYGVKYNSKVQVLDGMCSVPDVCVEQSCYIYRSRVREFRFLSALLDLWDIT